MSDAAFPAGTEQDVQEIRELITKAVSFTNWSRPTLCHRVCGNRDFEDRMVEGRVTIQHLARSKQALEDFIFAKQAEAA